MANFSKLLFGALTTVAIVTGFCAGARAGTADSVLLSRTVTAPITAERIEIRSANLLTSTEIKEVVPEQRLAVTNFDTPSEVKINQAEVLPTTNSIEIPLQPTEVLPVNETELKLIPSEVLPADRTEISLPPSGSLSANRTEMPTNRMLVTQQPSPVTPKASPQYHSKKIDGQKQRVDVPISQPVISQSARDLILPVRTPQSSVSDTRPGLEILDPNDPRIPLAWQQRNRIAFHIGNGTHGRVTQTWLRLSVTLSEHPNASAVIGHNQIFGGVFYQNQTNDNRGGIIGGIIF